MVDRLSSVELFHEVLRKISSLREVDSTIDIARGWLQLRILLALGFYNGIDVDGLVRILRERRKAVLDALRKMKNKELIVNNGGKVVLSEKGKALYNVIASSIGLENNGSSHRGVYDSLSFRSRRSKDPRIIHDIPRDLSRSFYLYDTIIALGSSKNYELPLSTLSSISKISPEVLDDYLKPYASPPYRIMRRIIKTAGLFFKRREVFYKLTDNGLKVYHKLPDYVKYRNHFGAKLLRLLSRSGHPRMVLKRISFIMSIGSAITMFLSVVMGGPASIIVMASWILFVSFLALLVELTY